MKRSLLAALLLPVIGQAQTTEFGNLNVVQNDAGNATTSVTISKGAGSSPNFSIRSGSTKADYNLAFGNANDYDAGVVVAAIAENGRNNRVEAAGLRLPPLPHHPACGSAPGGSNQITEL